MQYSTPNVWNMAALAFVAGMITLECQPSRAKSSVGTLCQMSCLLVYWPLFTHTHTHTHTDTDMDTDMDTDTEREKDRDTRFVVEIKSVSKDPWHQQR